MKFNIKSIQFCWKNYSWKVYIFLNENILKKKSTSELQFYNVPS